MHSPSLRELWTAAIIIRGISLVIGIRWRAPGWWIAWVAFSEAFDIALRLCYHSHAIGPHGWYVTLWVTSQIGGIILLSALTWQVSRPRPELIGCAAALAVAACTALSMLRQFPGSPLEPVIQFSGGAELALGIMAASKQTAMSMILTAYLILSAVLMLAAPVYLPTSLVSINKAIEWLEIGAFTSWAVIIKMNRAKLFLRDAD